MLPASPRRREVSNFGDGMVGRAKYTRARVRQIASRILANSRVRDYFVRPTFAKIRDYAQSSPIDNFLSI